MIYMIKNVISFILNTLVYTPCTLKVQDSNEMIFILKLYWLQKLISKGILLSLLYILGLVDYKNYVMISTYENQLSFTVK